jgi:hypothetical protein
VILLYKTFYFGKTCAETWNFSLTKKLYIRKIKLFCDRPSSFCSRYTNICDWAKKWTISNRGRRACAIIFAFSVDPPWLPGNLCSVWSKGTPSIPRQSFAPFWFNLTSVDQNWCVMIVPLTSSYRMAPQVFEWGIHCNNSAAIWIVGVIPVIILNDVASDCLLIGWYWYSLGANRHMIPMRPWNHAPRFTNKGK